MIDLDLVKEIREVGQTLANAMLEKGYHLLAVDTKTQMLRAAGGNWYVRRDMRYILGRTADQLPMLPVIKGLTPAARQARADALAITEAAEAGPAV